MCCLNSNPQSIIANVSIKTFLEFKRLNVWMDTDAILIFGKFLLEIRNLSRVSNKEEEC